MLDHLRDLVLHSAWADAVFFRAWEKGDQTDKEIRDRTAHSTGTQSFFVKTLTGTDDLPWDKILKGEVKPPWADRPLPEFEELRTRSRTNHAALAEIVNGLEEAGARRTVTIPWFNDPPCVLTVGEAIVQASLHTHHHRAQNIQRLRASGGEPKNVDYIIWIWKGRPEPVWESGRDASVSGEAP